VPEIAAMQIAAMLKAIMPAENVVAARQRAVQVIEKLRGLRLIKAVELVEAALETRVVGAFPDGRSALNLGAG
jgi:hypothetical protein